MPLSKGKSDISVPLKLKSLYYILAINTSPSPAFTKLLQNIVNISRLPSCSRGIASSDLAIRERVTNFQSAAQQIHPSPQLTSPDFRRIYQSAGAQKGDEFSKWYTPSQFNKKISYHHKDNFLSRAGRKPSNSRISIIRKILSSRGKKTRVPEALSGMSPKITSFSRCPVLPSE